MKKEKSARDFLPPKSTLPALSKASKHCRGCHLYKYAQQTVFGDGPRNAKLMVIGEIPGEKEDDIGEPFVGPAGKYLRKIFAEVGLEPKNIYFTNVVKHFKFSSINQKKLHRSPVPAEIRACIPWLEEEMKVIQPRVILCLGSVAAKAIIHKNLRIREQRGKWFKLNDQTQAMATFHPSALLRAPDEESRHEMKKQFLKDIKKIATIIKG